MEADSHNAQKTDGLRTQVNVEKEMDRCQGHALRYHVLTMS